MNANPLRDKARLVLQRRATPPGIGGYVRQHAVRHLVFSAIFWLIIVVAWSVGQHAAAFIVAGFWAGRLTRDLQWYSRLAAEWETTRELLDWQKVESLAKT
jgi:hypothetical protein